MKLRDSLKIFALLLLVESMIGAFKQPFMSNFDNIYESVGQFANVVKYYYTDISVWWQVVRYVSFSMHIVWMGSRMPNNRFQFYFVLDAIVAVANALVVFLSYEAMGLVFFFKLTTEAVAIVTCFLAGWALYRDLSIKPIRKICFSYWLLALRHILYCGILIVTLMVYGVNGISTQALQNQTTINIAWGLVVPIFVISRYMLYVGTKELKVNADNKEKEQTLKEI